MSWDLDEIKTAAAPAPVFSPSPANTPNTAQQPWRCSVSAPSHAPLAGAGRRGTEVTAGTVAHFTPAEFSQVGTSLDVSR